MYNAVIFDLDGTLLNTLEDLANAGNYALEQIGEQTHAVENFKKFIGSGKIRLVERMLSPEKNTPEILETCINNFDFYYGAHNTDTTRPYDGAIELLKKLRENGIKTGVVTNKPDGFSQALVKKYFGDLIDIVQGVGGSFKPKPDTSGMLYVMDKLGTTPENCLYVGDSDIDMITASNVKGLNSCGVLWGFMEEKDIKQENPTFMVSDMQGLEKIIFE